jgi:hypothetical protein
MSYSGALRCTDIPRRTSSLAPERRFGTRWGTRAFVSACPRVRHDSRMETCPRESADYRLDGHGRPCIPRSRTEVPMILCPADWPVAELATWALPQMIAATLPALAHDHTVREASIIAAK